MGNTESNEWNAAAGSGDGDSPKDNTTEAVGAAAALALTEWGLTKLVSSSASKEDEKTTNDKGKLMVGAGSSRGYPTNYFVDSPPNDQDLAHMMKKEKQDQLVETLKVVGTVAAVAVGVALVGWGLSMVEDGLGEKSKKKMMKAPGRDFHIFRDDFERDPSSYFRSLRD